MATTCGLGPLGPATPWAFRCPRWVNARPSVVVRGFSFCLAGTGTCQDGFPSSLRPLRSMPACTRMRMPAAAANIYGQSLLPCTTRPCVPRRLHTNSRSPLRATESRLNLVRSSPPTPPLCQFLDISPYTSAQCGEPGPVPPVIDAQGLVWVSCLGSNVVTRTALFNTSDGYWGPQCSVNIE